MKAEYKIPEWCRMHPVEHNDGMGGCWGIFHGHVALKGEDYCKECEYHENQVKREGAAQA